MLTRRELLRGACLGPAVWSTAVATAPDAWGESNALASLLEPIRKRFGLPALAGAILTSEGLKSVGAVGVRKQGDPTPAAPDDQFHFGSCTKAMTATLLAMLVEEGRLEWSTTLQKAIPGLASTMHPAYREVVLETVLAHRSGMPEDSWPKGASFQQMHELPGTAREQRWEYAKRVLAEEPANEPGSKFVYSNRNYAIAGVIAETIAEKAWEELITERLFSPLGMSSAGFGAMGRPGQVEQPWQHRKALLWTTPVEPGPRSDNPPVIAPAGTVHGSMGDWARFVAFHLAGEQGKPGLLLKPETVRRLHMPEAGSEYAFGWGTVERDWGGGKVLTHAGSNTMNYAVVWMAPKPDFAVLAATNVGGNQAAQACDATASALIQEHLKEAASP